MVGMGLLSLVAGPKPILDSSAASPTSEDTVPTDPMAQVGELALSAAYVNVAAVPLALLGWGFARALGRPVLPQPTHVPAGWNGFDIVFLFVVNLALNIVALLVLSASGFFQWVYGPDFPAKDGAAHQQVQVLWASLIATPLLLLAAAGLWSGVHGRPVRARASDLPGQVALGALGWAALTPVVFSVHFVAVLLANKFGGAVEDHPLTQLGAGDSAFDRVVFAVAVCIVTPLAEEFLFRGLLVRWAAGRAFRPWVLMLVAAGLTFYRFDGGISVGAVAFVAVLAGGLLVLRWYGRRNRVGWREAAGVYASAAVFAAAHSAVWPTPVPLFVLGLGLGYLALRTGGIAACVVLHGLFNAVSFVFLLRGGAT
jgi:membrane protease YdiL (CAAX protease family)